MTEQSSLSYISSDPCGVCFCDLANSSEMCKNTVMYTYLTKFLGETFNLSVTTVGQFNGTTLGVINTNLTNGHQTDELITFNSTSVHNLTYQLLSSKTEHSVTINFIAISTDVNTYYHPINAPLSLFLLPCPLGFHLTSNTLTLSNHCFSQV